MLPCEGIYNLERFMQFDSPKQLLRFNQHPDAEKYEGEKLSKWHTTESNGPCLNLSWNENAIGFGLSPGPLTNPLDWPKYTKESVPCTKHKHSASPKQKMTADILMCLFFWFYEFNEKIYV